MSPIRAESVVVGLNGSTPRKLFQVFFGKKDGSLYVGLPYFRQSDGVASLVRSEPGPASHEVNVRPGGKVTSHLVKYSHHPDGRAHFSQDGRVLTTIRKRAVPLDDVDGHVFTIHVRNLSAFDADDEPRAPDTRKRATVRFDNPEPASQSLKFVGMSYSVRSLQRRSPDGIIRHEIETITPDGLVRPARVCAPPAGRPGEHRCLVVTCESMRPLNPSAEPLLLFMGGFDAPSIVNDLSIPTTYLVAMYPAEDYDELRAELGSIDFDARSTARRAAKAD